MPAHDVFDRDEERRLFYEGIELFNDGEFFEAHEVWEDIWHNASGAKGRFYQGLIQVAVTLEHMNRENPRGVKAVWRSMLTKFDGLPDVYMGLDVRRFITGLQPVVQHVLDMPVVRGQQPHDVTIEWDHAAVPSIDLEYDPFERGEDRRSS